MKTDQGKQNYQHMTPWRFLHVEAGVHFLDFYKQLTPPMSNDQRGIQQTPEKRTRRHLTPESKS